MSDIFNRDFQQFIQCLNMSAVEYMLVGGYATIIHGYNRTTGDLDIWVNRTEKNYFRLTKAFQCFQMPLFDMTKVKGMNFEEAFLQAENKVIEQNMTIKVIDRNDLIKAKKASNRPKDQDDIDHLI